MKKTALSLLLAALLLLCACSGGGAQPSDTVRRFVEAFNEGDAEAMLDNHRPRHRRTAGEHAWPAHRRIGGDAGVGPEHGTADAARPLRPGHARCAAAGRLSRTHLLDRQRGSHRQRGGGRLHARHRTGRGDTDASRRLRAGEAQRQMVHHGHARSPDPGKGQPPPARNARPGARPAGRRSPPPTTKAPLSTRQAGLSHAHKATAGHSELRPSP